MSILVVVEGKVIAGFDVDAPYFGTEMKLEGLVCRVVGWWNLLSAP